MPTGNGGLIGVVNTPTTTLASGVWGIGEVFDAVKGGIWPFPLPAFDVLVVGGGSSGRDGHNDGGNGGAVEASTNVGFVVGSYTITVGAGGAQRSNGSQNGFNSGSNSSVSGTGVSLTALGATAAAKAGDNGANPGGGGAQGRDGGPGEEWSINSTDYGGGGGTAGGNGFETSPGGAGGAGGGGTGSTCCSTAGTAGTDGLGGGGGGGGISWCGQTYCGGRKGGNGAVIIAYPGTTAIATGGTITTSGGYVFHTFTSSGTFTI
jgi:hypothetical protein